MQRVNNNNKIIIKYQTNTTPGVTVLAMIRLVNFIWEIIFRKVYILDVVPMQRIHFKVTIPDVAQLGSLFKLFSLLLKKLPLIK